MNAFGDWRYVTKEDIATVGVMHDFKEAPLNAEAGACSLAERLNGERRWEKGGLGRLGERVSSFLALASGTFLIQNTFSFHGPVQ